MVMNTNLLDKQQVWNGHTYWIDVAAPVDIYLNIQTLGAPFSVMSLD